MSDYANIVKTPTVHSYQCYYCGKPTRLAKGEQIKCTHCGKQILMKPRCNYPIQYVAR